MLVQDEFYVTFACKHVTLNYYYFFHRTTLFPCAFSWFSHPDCDILLSAFRIYQVLNACRFRVLSRGDFNSPGSWLGLHYSLNLNLAADKMDYMLILDRVHQMAGYMLSFLIIIALYFSFP